MIRQLSVILVLSSLHFWQAQPESLAEYDQPTLDPGIFIFDEDFPQGDKDNLILETKEDTCETDGYYPDKEDCSLFHLCEKGRVYQFQCSPGLGFDPKLGSCNWKSQLQRVCNVPSKVDCPSLKYFGDLKNKSIFYRCVGRQKVRFQCPSGLVFNPEWSVCDRPNFI